MAELEIKRKAHDSATKPKRPYTVSEKVIERNKKYGFGARPEQINRSGKGGFADNPQNIRLNKQRPQIPDQWWNSYRECLKVFSALEMDTFMHIAGKFGIADPTNETEAIKKDLDNLYQFPDSPRKLTNLVDTAIRTLLQAKANPKLMFQVMEQTEGRATQRIETNNTNLTASLEEVEALKAQIEERDQQLQRLLAVRPAEVIEPLAIEGEIIESEDENA